MAAKARGSPPVWRIAAISRVAMLLLMLTFDALVDDYDTSGRLSPGDGVSGKPSIDAEHPKSPPSPLCAAVEGLVTWDAVYFLRISEAGYEHEQTHAFFPLLPAVTRGVASASSALAGAVAGGSEKGSGNEKSESGPSRCALAASALAVSNSAHVAAAVVLQKLGAIVLANDDIDGNAARDAARSAAALFALNPASAFHSAPYTESIFALLSFAGFYFLERASLSSYKTMSSTRNRNGAALCFALACAARSNGALNGLVLAHDFFARVAPAARAEARRRRRTKRLVSGVLALGPLLAATVAFAARCVVTLAPLFAVQLYGYRTYCARALGGDPPAWCSRWRPFPNVYAHVQSHYWNVGFLRYYELKQIPNFLLAAPALAVSASAGLCWWNTFARTEPRNQGGKGSDDEAEADGADANRTQTRSRSRRRSREEGSEHAWMLSPRVRPYLFKWAVMSVVALLAMHVQVTTRFLSVTPGIYWFLAKRGFAEAEREEKERKTSSVWRRAVTLYSILFFLLGALLFPTFYPWT